MYVAYYSPIKDQLAMMVENNMVLSCFPSDSL